MEEAAKRNMRSPAVGQIGQTASITVLTGAAESAT